MGFLLVDLTGQGLPVSFPAFTAPDGSKSTGGGIIGVAMPERSRVGAMPVGPDERSRVGVHMRLDTKLGASAIADHYLSQITALTWKETLRKDQPSLSVVRFRAGTDKDPLVGLLTVVPFPDKQNALVAIDLIQSRAPWRSSSSGPGGRGVGTGAAPAPAFEIQLEDFSQSEHQFSATIRLPPGVTRLEERGGGGGPDFFQEDCRLETTSSPAALMSFIEPQITRIGWAVDVRAGDAVQAITKFKSPPGGDSTAIIYITMMPGSTETSVLVAVVRNRR